MFGVGGDGLCLEPGEGVVNPGVGGGTQLAGCRGDAVASLVVNDQPQSIGVGLAIIGAAEELQIEEALVELSLVEGGLERRPESRTCADPGS